MSCHCRTAFRATMDRSNGAGTLFLDTADGTKKIDLTGVVNQVAEVCPLSDGRLAVFAFVAPADLGEIYFIDSRTGSMRDFFGGYSP